MKARKRKNHPPVKDLICIFKVMGDAAYNMGYRLGLLCEAVNAVKAANIKGKS